MVGGAVEMRGQLHGIIAQRLADEIGAVLGNLASPVNDVLTGGGIKAAVIAACILHLHPCPAYIFDGLPHSRFVVGHAGGHAQNGLIYGLLVGHGYGRSVGQVLQRPGGLRGDVARILYEPLILLAGQRMRHQRGFESRVGKVVLQGGVVHNDHLLLCQPGCGLELAGNIGDVCTHFQHDRVTVYAGGVHLTDFLYLRRYFLDEIQIDFIQIRNHFANGDIKLFLGQHGSSLLAGATPERCSRVVPILIGTTAIIRGNGDIALVGVGLLDSHSGLHFADFFLLDFLQGLFGLCAGFAKEPHTHLNFAHHAVIEHEDPLLQLGFGIGDNGIIPIERHLIFASWGEIVQVGVLIHRPHDLAQRTLKGLLVVGNGGIGTIAQDSQLSGRASVLASERVPRARPD